MGKRTSYKPGTFSWVDMATPDPAASKAFYSELLMWKFEDNPTPNGPYSMAKVNGLSVAALYEMAPEMKGHGPFWSSYITVKNVDVTVEKWKQKGGEVIAPAFDVMKSGRMAVLNDPTGAYVSLWEPKDHFGAEYVNHPGAFCWNELNTRDPQKAMTFYTDIFGWKFDKTVTQNGDYYMILNDGKMNGGLLDMTGMMPDEVIPHWNVYFTVENIEETNKKATGLGAKLLTDVITIDVGRFTAIQDPVGAHFTAIQLNEIDD